MVCLELRGHPVQTPHRSMIRNHRIPSRLVAEMCALRWLQMSLKCVPEPTNSSPDDSTRSPSFDPGLVAEMFFESIPPSNKRNHAPEFEPEHSHSASELGLFRVTYELTYSVCSVNRRGLFRELGLYLLGLFLFGFHLFGLFPRLTYELTFPVCTFSVCSVNSVCSG